MRHSNETTRKKWWTCTAFLTIQITCYNALAEEYRKMGDPKSLETAILYHQKELAVCEEEDAVQEAVVASRFLGDCYRERGEIKKAKQQYHRALALLRQECHHISDLYEEHTCSTSGRGHSNRNMKRSVWNDPF